MLKLWGRTNSSNVMKVLWLLDELGLPCDRVDAGMAFGGLDTPSYRAMNPFGMIPVLEDGATALFESNAILRYLCNAHAPASPLYPTDPASRGAVDAWMDAQMALAPPLGTVFMQMVRVPADQRDDAALAAGLAQSAEFFAILDAHLAHRAFLAGDSLTLADIAFGPFVHRWFALKIARPDMPALRAYYQLLLTRPAYQAHCAGPLS